MPPRGRLPRWTLHADWCAFFTEPNMIPSSASPTPKRDLNEGDGHCRGGPVWPPWVGAGPVFGVSPRPGRPRRAALQIILPSDELMTRQTLAPGIDLASRIEVLGTLPPWADRASRIEV